MSRVIIPKNPDENLALLNLVINKETALGAAKVLSDADLADLKNFRDAAKDANDKQKQFYKDAEEQTKLRNNALGIARGARANVPGSAMFILTKLRDNLLANNKTNAKVLGEWGFVVDDSPKPKKKTGA